MENSWIKVTDRLPEKGIKVLIFGELIGVSINELRPNGTWGFMGTGHIDGFVTHWQPLEPPKQEGGE
jgi:hypothetical protein